MIGPVLRAATLAGGLLLGNPVDSAVQAQKTLAPTAHPTLPANESDLWLVPSARSATARASTTSQTLATAVRRYRDGDYAAALATLTRLPASAALDDYVEYYKGLSQLRLGQFPDARRTLSAIVDRKPQGAVALTAALALGEAAETGGDQRDAMEIYRRLAETKGMVTDEVLTRLGRSALAAGDRKVAAEAYVRLYYEFALTDAAIAAGTQLQGLQDQVVKRSHQLDLGRAAMLFGARRYAEARTAFQDLQRQVSGDDRELVDLRIAECDFYLRRYQAAKDGVRPYLERASRKAEARFFHLSALRELGSHQEYLEQTRALVSDFPGDSWAEEALNNLGTHFIVTNDDEAAAAVFAELFEKFPAGARAERAAWKSGWWSYRRGEFADTVKTFETAAATFPRSDYRPSYLYWAARAHAALGQSEAAAARYRLVFHDYGSSYYGRLARRHVARAAGADPEQDRAIAASLHGPAAPPLPPTADRIRLLLANGLYDEAIEELRFAQRQWGTSPAIEATIAWAYHQKGELRRAITLMRRAYPQSLTSTGHLLPVAMRQVLFPLVYWDLIKRHANTYDLDPYLVAALINQESTFDPDIKSPANAWGLMQVVPATGRRLARALGIRRFSTATLTNPEANIRMGTLYFSRLVRQFGGTYYALASYNAGENRVVRWRAERPSDMDEDEFIDDIPFPETQNYVKRILGTAEDYRMLYGKDGGRPQAAVE